MNIVPSHTMRELDRKAIETYGIASLDLMEHAGEGVVRVIQKYFPGGHQRAVILVGRGNNGGDALVVARLLCQTFWNVSVWLMTLPRRLSPDAKKNWDRLQSHPFEYQVLSSENDMRMLIQNLTTTHLLVDGLFGTGLSKPLTGLVKKLVDEVNRAGRPLVSIDLPSGLHADSGEILGTALRAHHTVTLGLPKRGLFFAKGPTLAGRVHVVDIGIPSAEIKKMKTNEHLITAEDVVAAFPARPRAMHKGQAGHVLTLAGGRLMLGAGYLASRAALRIGAGLVSYALPDKACEKFDARDPEIIPAPLPDDGSAFLHPVGVDEALQLTRGKQAVAIGPGIGQSRDTAAFVEKFLSHVALPTVIDADALNCIAHHLDVLVKSHGVFVLTPHPGEMARLTGKKISSDPDIRAETARQFAKKWKAIVVLKGAGTVVGTPDGQVWINPTGNPGMATAGSGDALAGVIAGLLAQGVDPVCASIAGVFVHGLAGDLAAESIGSVGITASDVIDHLPRARESICSSCNR